MATSTVNTNKPIIPRGVDDRPVDKYNRAELYSGKALDFDGVNDSIDISDFSLNGYTAFSICFYKLTDTSASRWVFGNSDSISDGINVYQNADGTIRSRINALNFDTTNNHFKTNGFFVFTYNGTKGDWFVNGQSESTTTQSAQTLSITSGAKIAVPSYTTGSYYDGQIANFKIFNTALTAAQVADLYNNPEKVVPTGVSDSALKLWLPMQEGAGTTAYDGSGNGNHGTISGATYVNGVGVPVAQTAVIDWNKGTNIFTYSEDFSNADWTTSNLTTTADDAAAPDGQTTADKIVATTTNGTHYKYQDVSITNGLLYTFSTFIKSSGADCFRLEFGGYNNAFDNEYAVFNLNTGSVESNGGATNPTITSYNNDWYRISITATSTASATGRIVLYASEQNTNSFTGDGVNGYYIWGASLEQSATAGPYVHTGATAQTSPVLLPQGLTSGRDITGVNLFENVRKQGALNLDGNSWAEVHDNESLDITDAVSVEMWIYWENQSAERTILGKWLSGDNRAYALIATTTTGAIDFRQRVSSSTYSLAISTLSSGWNHVVATHDHSANERIGYINGVQVSTSSSQGVSNESDNDVTIGGHSVAQYTNSIAQPRIYNRALTASEVLNNYNATSSLYI